MSIRERVSGPRAPVHSDSLRQPRFLDRWGGGCVRAPSIGPRPEVWLPSATCLPVEAWINVASPLAPGATRAVASAPDRSSAIGDNASESPPLRVAFPQDGHRVIRGNGQLSLTTSGRGDGPPHQSAPSDITAAALTLLHRDSSRSRPDPTPQRGAGYGELSPQGQSLRR
jgi:hypothetical protein